MTVQRIVGKVNRVNGPVIEAEGITDAMIFELVKVGDEHLIGEIIKLEGTTAVVQVYEDTVGIAPGAPIYGDNIPLSIELGPGLIGGIYDGIQRPLEEIRKKSGTYIGRGVSAPSLNREKKWHFTPAAAVGDTISGGAVIGNVPETDQLTHRILVPPDINGTILTIAEEGDYTVTDIIATVRTGKEDRELSLMHRWPIRVSRPVKKRLPLEIPLIT
ncbi:MAG: V-type ATP synthase subunit A, partial [Candidatus Pacearchaeota archaeon]|nr:V-type ATP synthase subunit A [Candidatus Pacearchaeota archaeon]